MCIRNDKSSSRIPFHIDLTVLVGYQKVELFLQFLSLLFHITEFLIDICQAFFHFGRSCFRLYLLKIDLHQTVAKRLLGAFSAGIRIQLDCFQVSQTFQYLFEDGNRFHVSA